MPLQEDVHAKHGNWTCVQTRHGQAVEYIGVFKPEEGAHVQGALEHLWKSGIMKHKMRQNHFPLESEFWGEQEQAYIIRLERVKGDRLEAFADFAKRHEMAITVVKPPRIPKPRPKKPAAVRAPEAFPVAPTGLVRGVIERLHWNAEPASCAGENYITATTRDPVVAFQVAHYLKRKHESREPYIEEADFQHVNAKVNAAIQDLSPEKPTFHITIDRKHLERFCTDFPQACEPKPELDQGWVQRLHAASQRNDQDRGFRRKVMTQKQQPQLTLE